MRRGEIANMQVRTMIPTDVTFVEVFDAKFVPDEVIASMKV